MDESENIQRDAVHVVSSFEDVEWRRKRMKKKSTPGKKLENVMDEKKYTEEEEKTGRR